MDRRERDHQAVDGVLAGRVGAEDAELDRSRRLGDATLERRVDELASRSVAELEQLVAPGQVLLKLAISGFGVTLDTG